MSAYKVSWTTQTYCQNTYLFSALMVHIQVGNTLNASQVTKTQKVAIQTVEEVCHVVNRHKIHVLTPSHWGNREWL